INGGFIIHHFDLFQIATFSYFKVIRVMGRCDLYTSGFELFIYILISDHRDFSVCKRQLQHFSDEMFISLIVWIYSHCSIAQKSFRTGGCDFHKLSFFSYYRVIDVPEKSVLILMLYLCVRNRSLAYRAPVDDPGAFIDIAFLIKLDKYFLNGLRAAFVHGKTLSVPVSRSP